MNMYHRFAFIPLIIMFAYLPAWAQNYTRPDQNRSPSVIINLDALRNFDDGGEATGNRPTLTPPTPMKERTVPETPTVDKTDKKPTPMRITEPAQKPSKPIKKTPTVKTQKTTAAKDATKDKAAPEPKMQPKRQVVEQPEKRDKKPTPARVPEVDVTAGQAKKRPIPADDTDTQTAPDPTTGATADTIPDTTPEPTPLPDIMQDGERLSLQPPREGDNRADTILDDEIPTPPSMPSADQSASLQQDPDRQIKKMDQRTVTVTPGDITHIFYNGSATDIPTENKDTLAPIITYLKQNDAARLQIRAFADQSADQSASDARRLSLSRALALRSHLMDHGISSLRLDVRALGSGNALSDDTPTNLPKDRIDLRVIN